MPASICRAEARAEAIEQGAPPDDGGAFCFSRMTGMKTLIALLALILLIVPMLAGIKAMRRLPRPEREEQD